MADDVLLEPLRLSDQRLIRTVDSLTDSDWAGASLLPGWTRAHVVAHVALNAEGFDRALGGVQDGDVVPIYDSNASRDAAIKALAAKDPSDIRQRYYAATTALRHAFGSLTADQWQLTVTRLPEGPVWPVSELLLSRRREVEIHHADLGLAYAARDWPEDFTTTVLDTITENHSASEASEPFTAHATNLDRTWLVGARSPVVSGTAADLAWWLLGRGVGEQLTSDAGALPKIGPWTKPVRRP